MTKILHISTECYPAAKAGGMGDVVGALPLYLPKQDIEASVIIPKYRNAWFSKHSFKPIYKGNFLLGEENITYEIQKLEDGTLAYPFYCIDIPGKFDRKSIYLAADGHGFKDEPQRNISFQISVVDWLSKDKIVFDGLHCHDHMTGLIPFFIKFCPAYQKLEKIPTFFTIHNGQYRGIFDWSISKLLPEYPSKYNGMLDWDGYINSLATALKCAWSVNTVSPSYMKEVQQQEDTLKPLYQNEWPKSHGILNGIDNDLWNPVTDSYLDIHLQKKQWSTFKNKNKSYLYKQFNLKSKGPLIGYIGRMAHQKGADLLTASLEECLKSGQDLSCIILGSGDKKIEENIVLLAAKYPEKVAGIIAYDEKLARSIYAASDFLIMPSRFEPCGLNQMYAMRYGSIPIVTSLGGLKDTVPDIDQNGNGIVIKENNPRGISESLERAINLYNDKKAFNALRKKIVALDFSWDQSAAAYAKNYITYIDN